MIVGNHGLSHSVMILLTHMATPTLYGFDEYLWLNNLPILIYLVRDGDDLLLCWSGQPHPSTNTLNRNE